VGASRAVVIALGAEWVFRPECFFLSPGNAAPRGRVVREAGFAGVTTLDSLKGNVDEGDKRRCGGSWGLCRRAGKEKGRWVIRAWWPSPHDVIERVRPWARLNEDNCLQKPFSGGTWGGRGRLAAPLTVPGRLQRSSLGVCCRPGRSRISGALRRSADFHFLADFTLTTAP